MKIVHNLIEQTRTKPHLCAKPAPSRLQKKSLVHYLLTELTERFKMVQNQLHKYAVHIRARAVQPMNNHFLFLFSSLYHSLLPKPL